MNDTDEFNTVVDWAGRRPHRITTHTKAEKIGGFGVTNGDPSSLLPGSAVEHNPLVAIFIIQTNPWLSVGHDSDPKALLPRLVVETDPDPALSAELELSSNSSFVVSENDFTRLNDLPGSGEVGSCADNEARDHQTRYASASAPSANLWLQRIQVHRSGWFIVFPSVLLVAVQNG